MIYVFGTCELDMQQHVIRRAGQPVHLRPKAFAVLLYLVEHRDRVVTKEELCAQVWSEQCISDATLGSTLRAVRQAIGDRGEEQRLIQTVHGYGYRWVVPVKVRTVLCAPLEAAMPGSEALPVPPPEHREDTASRFPSILASLSGEHKVVTVLCCALDISILGTGALDLDARYGLVQMFYARVQDTVQQYGGTLQPPLGERVLVVFGAPQAQEDHAVRAGFTALTLLQHLDAWLYTAGLPGDVRLAVRIGVHTGPMVVGSLGAGPACLLALVGEVPSQAIALQEQAAPGTVLCSAATARLVQGRMDCTSVGITALTGQEATSVYAYTLHRGSPRHTTRGQPVQRVLSPFVGREHEMATLRTLVAQAAAGRGQVVGVVGEAGIGKSRLVVEFCNALAGQGLTALLGRCHSYGSTTSYLPILELLRHACGVTETDPPEVITLHVQRYLQAVGLDLETWGPALLHLLGLQESPAALTGLSPEMRKGRIMTLLTQLWLQVSRQQPLLLILEDLHWSDPSSEEWLTALVERIGGVPLLILGTYRPGYRPGWLDKSYVTQVALRPLTEAASRRVVQAVLPPIIQTTQLVPRLLATAEGNPFFLEELARTVVEQGATTTVPSIPETIQAVLLARLDRLPSTAKRLLQVAAVIGKDLALPLLQALIDVPEATLRRDLVHLQSAEFLYETGLIPEFHYTFKHVLTQEVTYQSLLRRTRQQYHAHIAQLLEAQFPTIAAAQPELLAQHYTEAGLTAEAIPYWQRAGERAVQRSANAEAVQHLSRGLELLATLPDTRARAQQELTLQLVLAPALMATRSQAAPEVEHSYARARALCQQVGESPQLFSALRGLCQFYRGRAALSTARGLGEQLYSLAQYETAPLALLEAHDALGSTLFFMGEYATAQRHLAQGMALARPAVQRGLGRHYDMAPEMRCLAYLALTLWCLGYPTQAVQRGQEALALTRDLAHPYSLATAHHFMARLYHHRREPAMVQAQAEALIALTTAQGFPLVEEFGTCHLGWALAMQGQSQVGLAQLRQGIAAVVAMGHTLSWPIWLVLLAEAMEHAGQFTAGRSLLSEARRALESKAQGDMLAEVYRLDGELLLQQPVPDVARAEICFQQALHLARRQQARSWELRAAISLARLWQRQGKCVEARALLASIYGWFTEGFDSVDLLEAKALLDELPY